MSDQIPDVVPSVESPVTPDAKLSSKRGLFIGLGIFLVAIIAGVSFFMTGNNSALKGDFDGQAQENNGINPIPEPPKDISIMADDISPKVVFQGQGAVVTFTAKLDIENASKEFFEIMIAKGSYITNQEDQAMSNVKMNKDYDKSYAVVTFDENIDQLPIGSKTFSINIGSDKITIKTPSVEIKAKPLAPIVTSITSDPAVITQGLDTVITITGSNLSSVSDITTDSALIGIYNKQFGNDSKLIFNAKFDAKAPLGDVKFSVVGPTGLSANTPVLKVLPPAPVITSMSPVSGILGQQNIAMTVIGSNLTGAKVVAMSGIGITDLKIVNDTTITFVISVPPGISLGNKTWNIVTASGSIATPSFEVKQEVKAAAPTPPPAPPARQDTERSSASTSSRSQGGRVPSRR